MAGTSGTRMAPLGPLTYNRGHLCPVLLPGCVTAKNVRLVMVAGRAFSRRSRISRAAESTIFKRLRLRPREKRLSQALRESYRALREPFQTPGAISGFRGPFQALGRSLQTVKGPFQAIRRSFQVLRGLFMGCWGGHKTPQQAPQGLEWPL